jgi:hypothetical protein
MPRVGACPAVCLTILVVLSILILDHGPAPSAEPAARPILRVEIGMHRASIESIYADAANRRLVSGSVDKTLPVWDLVTDKLARVQIKLADMAQEEFTIKPKLYVLAVGVSDYADSKLRLKCAAKDARDLAAALKRQEGGMYREVATRVLTDARATKDGILDGLEWLQKETTSHDVAVLFLAGHGGQGPGWHLLLSATKCESGEAEANRGSFFGHQEHAGEHCGQGGAVHRHLVCDGPA